MTVPPGASATAYASFPPQEGIALVDLQVVFESATDVIGPDGLHPNAAGYQLIAQSFSMWSSHEHALTANSLINLSAYRP